MLNMESKRKVCDANINVDFLHKMQIGMEVDELTLRKT